MVNPKEIFEMVSGGLGTIKTVLSSNNQCVATFDFLPVPEKFDSNQPIARIEVFRKDNKVTIFTYDIWLCKKSNSEYFIQTVAIVPAEEKVYHSIKGCYYTKTIKASAIAKFGINGNLTTGFITADFIFRFLLLADYGVNKVPTFIKVADIKDSQCKVEDLKGTICKN